LQPLREIFGIQSEYLNQKAEFKTAVFINSERAVPRRGDLAKRLGAAE
jgi:hypothetical protein